jgi:hypothetical protein
MTFYDSFARLGKNLDQITSPNNIAWTWRHYIRVFPKERLRLRLFAPWPGSGVVIVHLFP